MACGESDYIISLTYFFIYIWTNWREMSPSEEILPNSV